MRSLDHDGRRVPRSLLTAHDHDLVPIMFVFLLTTLLAAPPDGAGSASEPEPQTPATQRRARAPKLRRYLTRKLAAGPRHLEHGVLGVGVAGGFPHLYRVELSLGLLDHLTLGATAHYLPGQRVPNWSPVASVAFLRIGWLVVGAHYRQVLHPPPKADDDPLTPGFQERTHLALATVTAAQAWWSAGFDIGVANQRMIPEHPEATEEQYVVQTRLGGGLHVRLGTQRFGVTLQAQVPDLSAEAMVDLRFGLFEMRERRGWLDY
jgi:hypothetical protein